MNRILVRCLSTAIRDTVSMQQFRKFARSFKTCWSVGTDRFKCSMTQVLSIPNVKWRIFFNTITWDWKTHFCSRSLRNPLPFSDLEKFAGRHVDSRFVEVFGQNVWNWDHGRPGVECQSRSGQTHWRGSHQKRTVITDEKQTVHCETWRRKTKNG